MMQMRKIRMLVTRKEEQDKYFVALSLVHSIETIAQVVHHVQIPALVIEG